MSSGRGSSSGGPRGGASTRWPPSWGGPQHGHAVRKAVPGWRPGRGSGGRGRPWREHKRTLARRMGAGRVRLCTRDARACAKSDTRRPIRAVARPFVHTPPIGVCKVGHEAGRMAPFLSACAHPRVPRVHKRTRRRERPGSLRVREGPTAGGPARQAEMISSSQQGLPEQPLLCRAGPAGRSTDHCATCAGLPGRIRAAPGGGALDVLRGGHGTKAFGRACITPSYSWNATLGDK